MLDLGEFLTGVAIGIGIVAVIVRSVAFFIKHKDEILHQN